MDDQSKSAAKLALYLLKQPDGAEPPAPPSPRQPPQPAAAVGLARADSSTPAAAASTASVAAAGVISDAPRGGVGGGDQPEEEAASAGAAAAGEALEGLVQLLEQYYHPSNGGAWTPDLAVFLRQARPCPWLGARALPPRGWGRGPGRRAFAAAGAFECSVVGLLIKAPSGVWLGRPTQTH